MINLLAFLLFFAQETEVKDILVDFTETVALVHLPLKVQHNHTFFSPLNAEDLEIIENSMEVEVKAIREILTPLTIHFLFDLSTSNEHHLIKAKKAVRRLTQKMRKGDLGKVSFFSRTYQPLTDYTWNRKAILYKLSRLTPVGSTALYDGLAGALNELTEVSGSRLLVLFSDGHDLMSHTSEHELMAKIKDLGIPVYFVSFSGAPKGKPLLEAQHRFMTDLAFESRGDVLEGSSDYTATLLKLFEHQRKRHLVSYRAPDPENRDQWRSVIVRLKTCPNCELNYRRAYRLKPQ